MVKLKNIFIKALHEAGMFTVTIQPSSHDQQTRQEKELHVEDSKGKQIIIPKTIIKKKKYTVNYHLHT
jgi:hypothetical protein